MGYALTGTNVFTNHHRSEEKKEKKKTRHKSVTRGFIEDRRRLHPSTLKHDATVSSSPPERMSTFVLGMPEGLPFGGRLHLSMISVAD